VQITDFYQRRLRAESTGEGMTFVGRYMVGFLSLESLCGRPKMRNSVFGKINMDEVGRHPVGYVSYIVFKVSDVMREIQS